nr:integrase, catalytic region, zinc finger, CCHC-type, peptidase aspartic, catalytic [Tanacetum cinerariifolium]
MKDVFEELEAEVAQYVVDKKHDALERKNLRIANDNLIAECLSKEVFSVATNSELNVARYTGMTVAHTDVEARCLKLEIELANLCNTSHHDNQEELINCFSKLEVNHLNLQLKYQNLKDSFGNNPSTPDKDTHDFDPIFLIGKMQASLQRKDNVIRQLKKQLSQLQVTRSDTDSTLTVQTADSQITKLTEQVTNLQAQNNSFRAENDKIKQHYKELYDSIKITCAKHIEQVTALTTKNVNLKAQTLEKGNSVSKDQVKPKVLARGKHAIDVEPIVPRLRNNRDAHLDYLRHLKESVETIRDIELLEYAIGTCPQGSQKQEKQLTHIPLNRKKQVTFAKQSDKSDSNTHKHVMTVKTQKTNVPMPPSTGVNSCPNASGSKTKSHIKTNMILPAKGVNKLPVEDQPRTNKSYLRTSNRVDSSSRLKRTVINSNLDYVCQTCNKCLTSSNHDMCVATCLQSVVETPSIRHNCNVGQKVKQVWKPKQVRQVWKPTCKVLTTIGCLKHMMGNCSRLMNFMKKFIGIVRFGNDHFGAIMGYEDYVIGDSVISRVYYVEGLGHSSLLSSDQLLKWVAWASSLIVTSFGATKDYFNLENNRKLERVAFGSVRWKGTRVVLLGAKAAGSGVEYSTKERVALLGGQLCDNTIEKAALSCKMLLSQRPYEDSNLRRKTSTDLQSAAFDHSVTLPFPGRGPPSLLLAKLRVHEQVNERAMFLKGVTIFLFFPFPIPSMPGWALALD